MLTRVKRPRRRGYTHVRVILTMAATGMKCITILMLLGCAAVPTAAQSYCSLQVRVIDEQGRPVPNVMVRVLEDEERLQQNERHSGVVRFCDLGVGPVQVRVGGSGCRIVSIESVPLEWGKTVSQTVVYDGSTCNIDRIEIPAGICSIIFRFVTEDRKPIANVSLVPPARRTAPPISDSAGRMLVTLFPGETVQATATATGYTPAPIDQTCSGNASRNARWRDQFVMLEKR